MSEASELNAKLKLERELSAQLRGLSLEMVQEFARGAEFHQVPDFKEQAQVPLEAMLLAHFMRTGAIFSKTTARVLPRLAKPTGAELAEMDVALVQHFQDKAPKQAALILDTTNRQAQAAMDKAQEIEPDPSLIGVTATGLFARDLLSRVERIAMLETLAPAEAAKLTEVEVLLGLTASVVAVTAVTRPIKKTWRNQGDSRVRPAHSAAGGQTVLVGLPFTVMGQRLMFPGDDSLGASIENLINCRCFVSYDTDGIAEMRMAA